MRQWIIAGAALALLLASGCRSPGHFNVLRTSGSGNPAQEQDCATLASLEEASSLSPDWLEGGNTSASRRLVASLQADLTSALPMDRRIVNAKVRCLATLYGLRTQRQQVWMDTGARTSFVAAILSALSETSRTQGKYAGVAVLPAMIGQSEAFHPTRALFSAGQSSVDALLSRYESLQNMLAAADTNLITLPSQTGQDDPCRRLSLTDEQLLGLSTAALSEVGQHLRRFAMACQQAEGQRVAVRTLIANSPLPPGPTTMVNTTATTLLPNGNATSTTTVSTTTLPEVSGQFLSHRLVARRLICDVLYVDQQILRRDQEARTTPEAAAGRLITSPLRALNSLVTNGQGISPERLRATMALEDLEVRYTGIPEFARIAPDSIVTEDSELVARAAALQSAVAAGPPDPPPEDASPARLREYQAAVLTFESNKQLLSVIDLILKRRLALQDQAIAVSMAVGSLHMAMGYFGHLATPSVVRFKYDVGQQRFRLEIPPETTTSSLMDSACR